MDNEKLKKQLRDMCIAADGLATAMHLFYADVSSDILDDVITQAERENRQQEDFDRWMDMKRTVKTPCGPVRVINTDKTPKEQLDDILKNGMPDIQVERDPSFDDISYQVKKLVDDFYSTHDRDARLGIVEQIILVMFGLTPDELNERLKEEGNNYNAIINAVQHGIEDNPHHCGQDCQVDDGSADVNESKLTNIAPPSLQGLVGMQVVGVYPPEWKCDECIFSTMEDARCTKKVELVGGFMLCLAELPNSIVTE